MPIFQFLKDVFSGFSSFETGICIFVGLDFISISKKNGFIVKNKK